MSTKKRQAAQQKMPNKSSKLRKSSDFSCKENEENGPISEMVAPEDDRLEELDKVFRVKHPKALLEFWKFAKNLNPKSPRDAFVDLLSTKLVGPFKYLAGDCDEQQNSSEKMLTLSRFPCDLPEMQTLMVYKNGRFCYWRDSPSDSTPFLVHVSNESEHFPAMEIAGDLDLFFSIHCLMKKMGENKAQNFSKFVPNTFNFAEYEDTLKKVKAKRRKDSIGSPFHGIGIKVKVVDDVGYRTVTDNNRRLKRDIEAMGTTTDENVKSKLRQSFLELFSNIQYANDENDFGMGLEFGHDLFISNYECFDGLTKNVLKHAYELLGRKEFFEILDAHYAVGRNRGLTNGI